MKQGKKPPIPWRDTDVQIEGPVVAEFQKLFLDTWQLQKGPKLSERNYFPELKAAGNALVRAVGSSRDSPTGSRSFCMWPPSRFRNDRFT